MQLHNPRSLFQNELHFHSNGHIYEDLQSCLRSQRNEQSKCRTIIFAVINSIFLGKFKVAVKYSCNLTTFLLQARPRINKKLQCVLLIVRHTLSRRVQKVPICLMISFVVLQVDRFLWRCWLSGGGVCAEMDFKTTISDECKASFSFLCLVMLQLCKKIPIVI